MIPQTKICVHQLAGAREAQNRRWQYSILTQQVTLFWIFQFVSIFICTLKPAFSVIGLRGYLGFTLTKEETDADFMLIFVFTCQTRPINVNADAQILVTFNFNDVKFSYIAYTAILTTMIYSTSSFYAPFMESLMCKH